MCNLILARLAGVLLLLVTLPVHAASVTVFAAASLTDSMKEIAGRYEKQSGDKIVLNFAGSGLLARQIQEGAPADIFFSADESRITALEQQGLLECRVNLLGNTLVAVVLKDSENKISSANDLTSPDVKRVAIGEPKLVPAGTYAKTYLEGKKLWPAIAPKVIPCESVRAVLAAVESGNVEAGIVYQTDAAVSKKVKIAFSVPVAEGPKIIYSVALVKESKQPAAARKFFDWLKNESSAEAFRKAGFIVLEAAKTP
jgi:molybdate transport system substrate-binding protein